MFVTVVSSSLLSFAVGGMLIGSTYEYALVEAIPGQNEESMDLLYPACIAIGSIFMIVATLLAWIAINLGILLWGSPKTKEGRYISWYHKVVIEDWKTALGDGKIDDSSSNKSC